MMVLVGLELLLVSVGFELLLVCFCFLNIKTQIASKLMEYKKKKN